MKFSNQDKAQFAAKGISEEQVEEQLEMFRNGFPYLELKSAASVGNGVVSISQTDADSYIRLWETYCSGNGKITKFVPASGAASRMFKDLFAFLDAGYDEPQTDFEKKFFAGIDNFAFYDDLNAVCRTNQGCDVHGLMEQGRFKTVVANLLGKEGLNYGALPKGILKFHKYQEGARTPLEEHLVEGALYASGADRKVNLHFTVSPEHRALFEELASCSASAMSGRFNVRYDISFSEQKPSTDTIAADSDNAPFRNSDGSVLFRPGGHGALIANLNEIDADIVFIKNIDNVVPDSVKGDTVRYKKIIAGLLVSLQERIFSYIRLLESGTADRKQLDTVLRFLEETFCCTNDATCPMSDNDLRSYLFDKLNRPVRVCGMVRNVGEPGGGPFVARNADGSYSLQILESSQIDMSDTDKKRMFSEGTHFNPVDLVCALKNYRGEKFNLPDFVDRTTGFISSKSKNGRELKALELPGLWNGSMSDWNTLFVEVPLTTFNPVKTVNDLLRPQHQ